MRRRRVVQEEGGAGSPGGETTFVEIGSDQLSRVFAVPSWLRDLGLMAWLIVGVLLLLGGVVWLLALTSVIVIPVITAAIIAAVLSPVVGWLARHRLGRGGGSAIVLLLVIALGAGIVVMLLAGVTSQAPELEKSLHSAVDKAQSALKDAGVSTSKAKSAGDDASKSASDTFHALLEGRGHRRVGARLARGLPLVHRAEPVLPAQGRPADPPLDREPHGRSPRARPHDHGPDAAVAARLFRRRHGGGRLQRGRHRPGCVGPRPAPDRRDHA